MKRLVLLVAIGLLTTLPGWAQQREKGSTDRPFRLGGKVWMDLSAGDYDIRSGSEPKVVVRWAGRKSETRDVRVDLKTEGSQAWIETDGARHYRKITIEVPARTDIDVKMSAGDLRIEGIEGNKNVSLLAGDLNIDIGRTSDYRRLDASVKAGDLNARAFNVSKGGLWRSFNWQGPGRYELSVSLLAGDLTLSESGK